MDLTEFLEARLAEDEAAAKAWLPPVRLTGSSSWDDELNDSDLGPYSIEHAARHDPARVLREVEAKRKLIELADEATGLDMQVDSEFRTGTRDEDAEPYAGDLILRQMASVYSDHADYDPAWRLEK